MPSEFSEKAKAFIKRIPSGKVTTYGIIAAASGNPRAARQVSWLLHSSSMTDELPWHRVVNKSGRISLSHGQGYEIQKALLIEEGVRFNDDDIIDLVSHLWFP